nr:MFS transporter [Saccharothrix mutabilis subsp. capreolus]
MLSGLVPGVARDLSVSVAAAASLTSAYAIGMVLGAPVMALWSARWPRRRALLVFLSVFVAVHVIGAVTTSFPVLFGTRVVGAVVNAGFLAVAMSVVVAAKGPRATSVVVAAVTLSCVVGVPAGAVLAEWAGWRSAFWAVAVLCLPAFVFRFPATPSGHASVSHELRVLRLGSVRVALGLAVLVNAATFATFAYLAVLAEVVSPPLLLAAFGIGAFCGVTVAGRVGERVRWQAVAACAAGWAVLALVGDHPVALVVVTVVQGGLSFGVGSALVTAIVRAAADAPALGGAFATAALNVGAVAGPLLAGLAGHRSAPWTSAVLTTAALVTVLAARPGATRPRPPSPAPR